MTSGAQTHDSWFADVDWRLPRCSHQFQSLPLTPPPLVYSLRPLGVLGDEVASGCLYLAMKLFHVGADVDGPAYPCTGLWLVAVSRGDSAYLLGGILSCRCNRRWSLSGKGSFLGTDI
jgi:hypothetical protein